LDGTLYLGRTLFDFTPAFLACLDRLGIGRTFITNNCSISCDDYVLKLRDMGIPARPDQLYTSALSTIDHLGQALPDVRRLYILGTPSLCREFNSAGYCEVRGDDEPEAVVVSFDTHLTFDRLCKAAWWIRRGKPFVATHPDNTCPTDLETILVDCGSICACLERATGQRPDAVLGKPSPRIIELLLRRHNLAAGEVAVVGDRLRTDVTMARAAGVLGVLVMTGETRPEDVAGCDAPPDLIVADAGEFGGLLAQARSPKGNRRVNPGRPA